MRFSALLFVALAVALVACSCSGVAASVSRAAKRAPSGTCYALALAGGGDRAAYESGVVRGLVEALPEGEAAYQVVTGISAGSTLTAAFSVFPLGDESAALDMIYSIIAQLDQESIYTQWPGGVIEGFFNHSSLFDSTPLRQLFTKILEGKTVAQDRMSCMGVSNLGSGLFERLCEHKDTASVVDSAVASAAIPGVFIDQTINGQTYVDGGITVNVDVTGAVEGCLALGYAQSQIVVDTVECGGANITALPSDQDPAKMTVLPVLLRALAMREFANSEDDYLDAVHAYPDVTFRTHIFPSQPIPGSSLDFNHTTMLWMQKLGEEDARNAVKQQAHNRFQTRIALE